MQNDKTAGGFTEEDMQQAVEYLFSKAIDSKADDMLNSNPNSYFPYSLLKDKISRSGLSDVAEGLEAHHLLQKRWVHVIGVAEDSIISTPLTPLWHRGVRGKYTEIIKEGANIDKLIRRAMQGMGADLKNPTVEQLWKAHKDVYTDLGRECWAKAIHKQYFESRGITY
jgi:hypothetical protein